MRNYQDETKEPKMKNLEFKAVVLEADKPTVNGRIYPLDIVKQMIKDVHRKTKTSPRCIFIRLYQNIDNPTSGDIIGFVKKIQLRERKVIITGEYLNTPLPREIMKLPFGQLFFFTIGIGEENNKIITKFELTGIGVQPKESK